MASAHVQHFIDPPDDRPESLTGRTYQRRIQTADGIDALLHITICDLDGKPFEIFVNCSDARFTEFTAVAMILASRLLRAGITPAVIAEDLQAIHSPFTSHYSVETQQFCPSVAASIGAVILTHTENTP